MTDAINPPLETFAWCAGATPRPFPLDGGRVGDGGVRTIVAEHPSEAPPPSHAPDRTRPAHTPTQLSPIEGEGFGLSSPTHDAKSAKNWIPTSAGMSGKGISTGALPACGHRHAA